MAKYCRVPTIKLLELVFTTACLTLHVLSLQPEMALHALLLSATFGAFLVIEMGVVIGHLVRDLVPMLVDALYSLVGAVLFVACGVESLRFWDDEPRELSVVRYGLWTGLVSCVTSVLYVLDTFLVIRGGTTCAGEPYSSD